MIYETGCQSFALLCFRGTECQSFAVFWFYGSELRRVLVSKVQSDRTSK